MKIWDAHCHLWDHNTNWLPGSTPEARLDLMAEIGQQVGITRFNVFIRMEHFRRDKVNNPAWNQGVVEGVKAHKGRMFPYLYLYIDDATNIQRSLDQMEKYIADGDFVGIKFAGDSGRCHRIEADPVFARAIELKAVIVIHTWLLTGGDPPRWAGDPRPLESKPADVVELAGRYPDYPFVCIHNGGDWEIGTRDVVGADNVWTEISGGFPWRGQVDLAVSELGADKIIFGSDISGRAYATQMGKVWGARISNHEKQLIFNDNMELLTMPILNDKNIVPV